jgi:hypothetical protein
MWPQGTSGCEVVVRLQSALGAAFLHQESGAISMAWRWCENLDLQSHLPPVTQIVKSMAAHIAGRAQSEA